MRLRKPCEHDRYDEHPGFTDGNFVWHPWCPGGEFLSEDALRSTVFSVVMNYYGGEESDTEDARYTTELTNRILNAIDVLADQVGEPG